jgi:hypothetical protein
MPQNPKAINSAQPIVEQDSTMSQVFRTWLLQVSKTIPIVGTGSPEGVVEAPQYSIFIDETTPAVPIEYIKMIPEIAGDRSSGWVNFGGGGGGAVTSVFGRIGAVTAQSGDYTASQVTNSFDVVADDTDSIIEGATNLFFTGAERIALLKGRLIYSLPVLSKPS